MPRLSSFLDNVHTFFGKSNLFRNVILNKRTDYDYAYEHLDNVGCDLIAELPYIDEMIRATNEKSVLYKKITDKEYQMGIVNILDSMEL